MKKRILYFALAATLIFSNLGFHTQVYAAGTQITVTKDADAPYTGKEYIATCDKTKASETSPSLPSGWEWSNPDFVLTTEFVNTEVIQKSGGTETNRVTVKVKKEIDSVAPTGSIQITTNTWSSFLSDITFGKIFKATQSVTIESSDNVAVASVKYYASKQKLSLEEVKALGSQWKDYPSAGFDVEPTSKYVVYAMITDTSDNKCYISSDGLILLTETAPGLFVTDVTTNSFKVKLTVDDSVIEGYQKVGIYHRKKGDSTWTKAEASTVSASNEVTVTGLLPGTDYEVRSFVTYIDNTQQATTEENATTITTDVTAKPTGSISVGIKNTSDESKDVVITVEKGNSVIASVSKEGITNNGVLVNSGHFKELADGVYNIVLRTTDGKYTETKMITIANGSSNEVLFEITKGELKSLVEVKGEDTPPVAVEGIKETLENNEAVISAEDKRKVENGEISVDVIFEVEEKDESAATGSTAINHLAENKGLTIGLFLDMSLFKVTTVLSGDNAGESSSSNVGGVNTNVLEIAVPYDTTKSNISVFRCHNGVTTELTKLTSKPTTDFTDGTYYVGDGYIYIYASGFSTYAIGESDTRADGPAAPTGLTPVAPTFQGGNDGKIGGVTTDMEYSTDNGANWTPVTVNPITGLTPGKVLIRVKGTDTTKPGATAEVTVPDYTSNPGKNPGPAAPTGITTTAPTSQGGTDGKVKGVDSTMEYSTDGGATWTPVTGTEITGLIGETSVTVRVKETEDTEAGQSVVVVVPKYTNNNGDNTPSDTSSNHQEKTDDSNSSSNVTSKKKGPAAPSGVSAIAPTSKVGTDGKITGVDENMEYSTDGGKTWKDVKGTEITGLSAGEVWIRVKETKDTEAGDVLKMKVPEYEAPASDEPITTPKTGDNNNIVFWIGMMIAGIMLLFIVLITGKRRKEEEQ